MRVIPVIDILNGIAVHAVRGKRSEYKPLVSVLCPSAKPSEIAFAFKKLGFSRLYIADLDAIMKKSSNLAVIRQIAKSTGLDLMVDAGTTSRRIKGSSIEVKNQENLLRLSEERFINGLRLHYNQFMNSKEELLNAKKQLDFARKLSDLTNRSFELGASSLKEKLESEDVFQKAEIDYYTAIAKYMMAEFKLKVKMRIDSVSVNREQ